MQEQRIYIVLQNEMYRKNNRTIEGKFILDLRENDGTSLAICRVALYFLERKSFCSHLISLLQGVHTDNNYRWNEYL